MSTVVQVTDNVITINEGASNVSIPLPVAQGGTASTTASAAINTLLPTQVGQSGLFLTTNGTNVSWAAAGGGGTVLVTGGGTGLTTLTAHAVMLGEGTSNVGFATIGTAGRLLIDQGAGADPAFTAVSGDITISSAGVTTLATVGVAKGGTGSTTLTAHAVLLGEGTSALGFATIGTAGRLLIDQGAAADPAFTALSGDATITSAGVITLGTVSIAKGGTGQTTASAAFNALSPMTTLGDTIYGGTSGAGTRLAGSTSATKQFMTQTGTGTVSAAPAWGTIATGDLGTGTANSSSFLRGDLTWSAALATSVSNSDGTLTISPTTGAVVASIALGHANTWTAQIIVSTSNAAAFSVGPNGDTNPCLRVVTNVASAATGISVTGNAAGSGATITVLSSGTNEGLTITPKGSGNVTVSSGTLICSQSPQAILMNGALPRLTFHNNSQAIAYDDNGGFQFILASTQVFFLGNADGTNPTALLNIPLDAQVGLIVAQHSGTQSADLAEFTASNGTTVLSRVTPAGWIQNTPGRARVTANVTNATATMSNLSDLTVTLVAGRKYTGKVVYFAKNSTAAEGLAFDFNGGTATMTSFEAGFAATPPGSGLVLGTLTSTAIGTALTATTATTADAVYTIEFGLVVNAGGTFIPRFAEVSHSTGTATVELNSYLWIEDSPN